ncbi:hypothetical protein Tco_0472954 [Tanacetum coccineum]
MGESAKRHEENSILIKEIRASTNVAIRNQGASIKTLEIQIGQMSKNSKLSYEGTRQIDVTSCPAAGTRECDKYFAILEDMDTYRDEGIGDVIFGEPFLREVGIDAKQFEGMIPIHNGNEEVTYRMDTANSGQKKETKAMVFHQMDTEEVSDRFVSPCFVNGLEAYDGEINLGVEKNMISNEYAVKLYLEHEKGYEEEEKSLDDWDHLLDFNLDYISLLGGEELSPFICKMGKSSHNKKRSMENLSFFYQDIGISSSAGGHLTQEEAAKEALAIRISQKFALLEELRHVIETMAYQDKYKKILDEIWKDKVELDGKIMNEEEEAVKSIKGEALKEKDDPGAFIFHIRLERQVNKNALADTGSDINTMPYRIYEQLGREEMKKVDRGIMMINHTQAEAMGILTNVLCHR